jgi:hypothetical protein
LDLALNNLAQLLQATNRLGALARLGVVGDAREQPTRGR